MPENATKPGVSRKALDAAMSCTARVMQYASGCIGLNAFVADQSRKTSCSPASVALQMALNFRSRRISGFALLFQASTSVSPPCRASLFLCNHYEKPKQQLFPAA